ncbi:MAG: hypothetical protein HPY45_11110 [Anaerolineae bacterium]|nr:hypothetical protein [Anaerolineae bacterium]
MRIVERLLADKRIVWLGLFLLAVAGVVLMIYITPNGMGLVNDSVGYIGGARNILAGNGYSRLTGDHSVVPVTNYPPMFSIVLAALGVFGLDAIPASWWLNILLFGVNVLLTGWVVYRMTSAALFGWLAALIFGVSAPIFQTHSFAMTEPLYLFLSYVLLLLLIAYLHKPIWIWLVLAGVVAGMAFLTRYVAVSLYVLVGVALLAGRSGWRERLFSILIFLVGALPLPIAWLMRNMAVSENVANRQFGFHPIPTDKLTEGLLNFWGWLLPERAGLVERLLPLWSVVLALVLLAFLGFVVWGAMRGWRGALLSDRRFFFVWIFALLAASYTAVLWLSLTFVDASPILEHRILSPLYVAAIVLMLAGFDWLWRRKAVAARVVVVVLAVFLLLSLSEDSLDVARDLHQDGQGFASRVWRESEVIRAVRSLPEQGLLVSNKATAIYILTGIPSFILPSPLNPATGQPRQGYREDVARIRQLVREGKGFLVVFDYEQLKEEEEGKSWMADVASDLPVYGRYADGVIFGLSR